MSEEEDMMDFGNKAGIALKLHINQVLEGTIIPLKDKKGNFTVNKLLVNLPTTSLKTERVWIQGIVKEITDNEILISDNSGEIRCSLKRILKHESIHHHMKIIKIGRRIMVIGKIIIINNQIAIKIYQVIDRNAIEGADKNWIEVVEQIQREVYADPHFKEIFPHDE